MWVCEILEWHMKRHFSQQEKRKQNHHPPRMVFRRSVRLMDTYASLEAKRTPDVWEGIPRLKWITLEQNILSQIGLCLNLNSLLLLEDGVREGASCPLAWWGRGPHSAMNLLQMATYTLILFFFFSQQSKYKVKHDWAIVLVMHNVYASKNRRKIEKSTLTKVSPESVPAAPVKGPRETQENNT